MRAALCSCPLEAHTGGARSPDLGTPTRPAGASPALGRPSSEARGGQASPPPGTRGLHAAHAHIAWRCVCPGPLPEPPASASPVPARWPELEVSTESDVFLLWETVATLSRENGTGRGDAGKSGRASMKAPRETQRRPACPAGSHPSPPPGLGRVQVRRPKRTGGSGMALSLHRPHTAGR